LEIYQEQIRDLLMPDNSSKEISIRESKGSITICGIHEETVDTAAQMQRCIEVGILNRSTGDTQVHSRSSRSHAIFTITLEERALQKTDSMYPEKEEVILKRSKFHLVDLAGSERLKKTGAEGVRLKESVKINSGLLTLGKVISILGQDPKTSLLNSTPTSERHIPYRDSKLTRLLQDSLGGNSQTVMIACISPLEDDLDESLNTLKYAYRARKIQNKPIVNIIDQHAIEFSNMQSQIETLQEKLKERANEESTSNLMVNFDDPQWMLTFMEELKSRTMRGTSMLFTL
jgi:hypothetical protein